MDTGGRGLTGPAKPPLRRLPGLPAARCTRAPQRGGEARRPPFAPVRAPPTALAVAIRFKRALSTPYLPPRTSTVSTGPSLQPQPHAPSSDSARLSGPEPRDREE